MPYKIPMAPLSEPMWWEQDPDEALMRQFAPPAAAAPVVPRGTSPLRSNVPPPEPPPRDLSLSMADDLPQFEAKPNIPMGEGVADSGYIRGSAPDPYYDRYGELSRRQAEHLRARPVASDKQYDRPAWMKALMVGANAAAGLVNASGRTRVAPLSQEMLSSRPKFDAAMAQWESEGSGMNAELAALEHEREKKRLEENDILRKRQAESSIAMNEAHSNYYNRPQRETVARPFGVTGGYIDADGTFHRTDQTTAKERPDQAGKRMAADLIAQGLLKPGSPEHAYLLTTGRLPTPKAPKAGGTKRDSGRARQSTFVAIEARKKNALAKAESDFSKVMDDAASSKEAKAAAKAELDRRKQEAQIGYEAEIEAAGGSISPAPTAPGMVKLRAPDGSVREVPAAQAEHFIKRGAKRVP